MGKAVSEQGVEREKRSTEREEVDGKEGEVRFSSLQRRRYEIRLLIPARHRGDLRSAAPAPKPMSPR